MITILTAEEARNTAAEIPEYILRQVRDSITEAINDQEQEFSVEADWLMDWSHRSLLKEFLESLGYTYISQGSYDEVTFSFAEEE